MSESSCVARASMSPPVAILTKKSCSTRAASTSAHFGLAGVSFALAAASAMTAASSGLAAATWSPSDYLAGTRPAPARIDWYSSLKMIFMALSASSGLADFAEMAMFEPPAKTCAAPPSLPGRAK